MKNYKEQECSVIHSESGQIVNPIYYDKSSREVSYITEKSSYICTCFDYELTCSVGNVHLKTLLNGLPHHKSVKLKRNIVRDYENTEENHLSF
ncbi:MAG: hypothetical protein CVV24_10255 [Ignavibacteriae bacterium HGW-Ignavibacteriae-3]|nr:MAG: hypothetical protein CVV24_10255 [Ignavibacteriae bacterium HGW-Ignavibacteriae-3]